MSDNIPMQWTKFLGGRVDRRTPLFINLTHTRMCVYFKKRVSARPPGLPSTFYIAVCVDLFHASFAYQPSACTGGSYHFVLISGFLEEHAEAVEGHRLLDGAPGDEFVGDLGGGHEPAFAGAGDVEIIASIYISISDYLIALKKCIFM